MEKRIKGKWIYENNRDGLKYYTIASTVNEIAEKL